jgi:hypothetical protein
MSSRTTIHTVLSLALLVLALLALPVQAEKVSPAPPQCQAHPVCSGQAPQAAPRADFLVPQASSTPTLLGAQQYIGDCCPNNDSTQCPHVNGYSSVHCGFPMCASGFLTCIYQ